MPRYYFHVRNPVKRMVDCEGVVLADNEAARAKAELAVQDFFRPSLNAVEPEWADCTLEVRDARGCRVADIAFADAAKLAAQRGALPDAQLAVAQVVHLDFERARREFAALERRARELLGQTHKLVTQQRDAAQHLSNELQAMQELRKSSLQIVARARAQSSAHGLHATEAVSA
jgi:hypothetical protein